MIRANMQTAVKQVSLTSVTGYRKSSIYWPREKMLYIGSASDLSHGACLQLKGCRNETVCDVWRGSHESTCMTRRFVSNMYEGKACIRCVCVLFWGCSTICTPQNFIFMLRSVP